MSKYRDLQQRLIKVSIIAVATVSAFGAFFYALYTWQDSLAADYKKVQIRLRTARSDIAVREQKADDAEKYMGLYETIMGASEQDKLGELNRNKAQDWISNAAAELQLGDLTGVFDPVVSLDSGAFKKKTLQGVTSKVTLNFSAMTDEQLFKFMEAIIVDFPGYVKINKVSIDKRGDIDDAALLSAGRGRFTDFVSGTMEFNWIAIKKLEATPPPANDYMQEDY